MRYRAIVYFEGPKSLFARRPHESDYVHTIETRWLCAARFIARGALGNTGRCGYVIMEGDKLIEQRHPTAKPYMHQLGA